MGISFKLLQERGILLKTEKQKLLIVSDLHLGFERSLYSEGITVPYLSEQLITDLKEIIKKYSIASIIFLGDIKHTILGFSNYEKKMLKVLLKYLIDNDIKYYFVKGNHDSKLYEYLKENKFPKAIGNTLFLLSRKVSLFHGHYIPKEAFRSSIWVTSHIHPAIRLPLASNVLFPIYIIGRIKNKHIMSFFNSSIVSTKYIEVYVLPPFNKYLLSNQLQTLELERENGKGRKRKNINDLVLRFAKFMNVYLTNGTYLGKLDSFINTKNT